MRMASRSSISRLKSYMPYASTEAMSCSRFWARAFSSPSASLLGRSVSCAMKLRCSAITRVCLSPLDRDPALAQLGYERVFAEHAATQAGPAQTRQAEQERGLLRTSVA